MSIEKLRPSFTFDQDRLDELREVVPEAFADGKVNWDALREALGQYVEDEDADAEHFGLFWPGKREARRLASRPSKGTLVPQPGLGVNEDVTRHVFIEGDNLEVLKLLRKSYAGRVKVIYIDPPYNRGDDLIYRDDYREPLEGYLQRTTQADDSGQLLTTNPKSAGRFHSVWLSMMYPRLRLARELLSDDGVIFVSIDDNEVHNLRQAMNEIFGEENFITMFVWEKTQHFGRQKINVYSNADYVLAYVRNLHSADGGVKARRLVERVIEELEDAPLYNRSNRPTTITFPAGSTHFNIPDGRYSESTDAKYELLSDVHVINGINESEFTMRFRSRWSGNTLLEEYQKGARFWVKTSKFAIRVIYQEDKTSLSSPRQIIFSNANNPLATHDRFGRKVGTSEEGTHELNSLLGVNLEQMYPKPSSLLGYLISTVFDEQRVSFDKDAIVMDFFAGSCTTAHAVLHLNRSDGGQRRFIMVQLPEPVAANSAASKANLSTIADIGRERIRRVITRMEADTEGHFDLRPHEDLGFRCYRLDRSHFKEWQDYDGDDVTRVATLFDHFESPLVHGWEPDALLTQILLMEGFPLDSRVAVQKGFSENEVRLVTSDFHQHRLLVCLDDALADQTIANLDMQDQDIFVCLDTALTDEAKVRLSDAGNIHAI